MTRHAPIDWTNRHHVADYHARAILAEGTAPAILPPAMPRTLDAQAEAEAARLDAMRHGAAPFALLTRGARRAFAS